MSRTEDVFKPAMEGKKIPILTLDHKWHKLFSQRGITPEMKEKIDEVNRLLKEQGKINTEIKQIKAIKKRLMEEMVSLADRIDAGDAHAEKEMDEHKKLIEESNQKLEAHQDLLLDIPRDISKANYELMLLSMEVCYQTIQENTEQINEIANWVTNIRVELKKNLIRKQEMEQKNHNLYSYMHDIFGAEVIDLFDMKYIPEEIKKKELSESQSNS